MFESSHRKLNKKFNWPGNIRDILCRYGFNDIWISQDVVDEDNFLCEFIKQRIIDCFQFKSRWFLPVIRFNILFTHVIIFFTIQYKMKFVFYI
jgi:hypothetical protein